MPKTQKVPFVDKETCETMQREEWEVLEVSRSYISYELCMWTETHQVHIPGFSFE